MGYITNYSLSVEESSESRVEREKMIAELKAQVESIEDPQLKELAQKGLVSKIRELRKDWELELRRIVGYDPLEESCKWYEHEENMRELSRINPEVIFTLKGEGEESGDIWAKYFHQGKMQHAQAQIKFEEFDPLKLY